MSNFSESTGTIQFQTMNHQIHYTFLYLLQAGADAGFCDINRRNALIFSVIFNRGLLVDLLLTAVDFNVNQVGGLDYMVD